jgi:hypothetical protein
MSAERMITDAELAEREALHKAAFFVGGPSKAAREGMMPDELKWYCYSANTEPALRARLREVDAMLQRAENLLSDQNSRACYSLSLEIMDYFAAVSAKADAK